MEQEKLERLKSDIKYFREEKWDLERFTWFDDIKENFPFVYRAWVDFQYAKKMLDLIVADIT
jgi:hypothetical protein